MDDYTDIQPTDSDSQHPEVFSVPDRIAALEARSAVIGEWLRKEEKIAKHTSRRWYERMERRPKWSHLGAAFLADLARYAVAARDRRNAARRASRPASRRWHETSPEERRARKYRLAKERRRRMREEKEALKKLTSISGESGSAA